MLRKLLVALTKMVDDISAWVLSAPLAIWAVAAAVILATTLVCVRVSDMDPAYTFVSRKVLHIIALSCSAVAIFFAGAYAQLLGFVFIGCSIGLAIMIKKGLLHIGSADSYGIPLFALALGALLISLMVSSEHIAVAAIVLGWADALASLVGKYYGRYHYVWLAEEKSILGSMVFALVTGCIILLWGYTLDWPFLLLVVLSTTIAEALSVRGSDNMSIPVVFALLMQGGQSSVYPDSIFFLSLLFVGGLVVTVSMRWLTIGGAVAAFVLASSIALVEPILLLFPFTFLVIGSLLSKISRAADHDRSGRTAAQVLSNGLPALVAALLAWAGDPSLWSVAIVLSFGVALTDTVSSEIGRRYGGQPYDVISRARVPAGLSGGVSLVGTGAAILTAMLYSVLVAVTMSWSLALCAVIAFASIAGMLVDSILGSRWQATYADDGQLSDTGISLVSGYRWMTNDLVNLLAISISVIAIVIGLLALY